MAVRPLTVIADAAAEAPTARAKQAASSQSDGALQRLGGTWPLWMLAMSRMTVGLLLVLAVCVERCVAW